MLVDLIVANGWGPEQWLAASILVFITISLFVVMVRALSLIQMSRESAYRPNLRPLRRRRFE
ncbi:MAG TPA: hypothetical protein DEF79_08105 [Gammaproteobacteria bacterium]|nr:hypothetical protein [Gammaproteobacteria bacterium]